MGLIYDRVYQQLKVDEHIANLNMTTHRFDERWNVVYGSSSRHFENGYLNIFLLICRHKLSAFKVSFLLWLT